MDVTAKERRGGMFNSMNPRMNGYLRRTGRAVKQHVRGGNSEEKSGLVKDDGQKLKFRPSKKEGKKATERSLTPHLAELPDAQPHSAAYHLYYALPPGSTTTFQVFRWPPQ